jgi:hypothetical protein
VERGVGVPRHFPHCRVGLVTGWGDQLDTELVASSGVAFVLARPFEATEVVRLVATALRATVNVRRLNATVTRTGTGAFS